MEKLFSCVKERAGYDDSKVFPCWERLKLMEINEFASSRYCYHKDCYKNCTNATELKRSKERYEKKRTTGVKPSDVTSEPNSDSFDSTYSEQRKSLRSSASIHDKNACIICQKEGGKLHKVCLKKTGEKMLEVAKKLSDRSFFLRLNSIPNADDAIANNVQYISVCWVLAQRSVNSSSTTIQELEDIDRVLADIEIVNKMQDVLNESPDTVLDM